MSGSGLKMSGSGQVWMGVGGSKWKGMGVDGSGWKQMQVDGSGWEHGLVQPITKKNQRKFCFHFIIHQLYVS